MRHGTKDSDYRQHGGGAALALDQNLRDEKAVGVIAVFVNGPPAALCNRAMAAIADSLDKLEAAAAIKWAKQLRTKK